MSQDIVLGRIVSWQEDGSVLISAPIPNLDRATLRKYDKVEVGFADGRKITPEQRRKVYALLNEIADFTGEDVGEAKQTMKMEFVLNGMQGMARKMFSLSDAPISLVSDFISFLVEFIVKHDIPTSQRVSELCEDIGRYVYACLMNKKCAVCGRKADLHHIDAVGAGRDRTKINHIGMRCLPLCREHHTQIHTCGASEFLELYHLQPVAIDEQIAKVYKLNTKEKEK